jgi:hypothetical protein
MFLSSKVLVNYMYRPEDHIHQLAEYIKKNISKGYTLESLRFSLVTQGYSRISVEKAIDLAHKELADAAPIMKEKPQISYRQITTEIEEEPGFFKKVFRKLFG